MQILDVSLLLEQATAEQIRLAQMISDHNDADFEEKVKQVSRCTSCRFSVAPLYNGDTLFYWLISIELLLLCFAFDV